MSKPPPLPAEVLKRVLRISAIDGRVLVFLAGGFGLLSAFGADWLGAFIGGLAAGAGVIELHGRRRLQNGDNTGVAWLVRSQLLLLVVILAYVAYQYFHYDPLPMLAKIEDGLAEAQRSQGMEPTSLAETLGLTRAEYIALIKNSVHRAYLAVGVATVAFQGGLAFYYHRKSDVITQALRKS